MLPIETIRTVSASEIAEVTEEILINRAEIVSGEAIVPGETYRLKIRWPARAQAVIGAEAAPVSSSGKVKRRKLKEKENYGSGGGLGVGTPMMA